ncbi:hemolysin family protein [Aestuariivirga sp.]|jgi:CBS domain containing-hemolysin-like protein|uniref:hemolysin family protein n=1 Tax=Aestuariivirga sp. TaxID=2650926 RepID=UPI003783EEA9
MTDTDREDATLQSERGHESLWQRLRTRFARGRDKGLRESLAGAIETHEAQNPGEAVGQEAKSMMLNIIEFSSLRVDDVMVPRVDIVAIEETDTMQDLLAKFIDANHSRIPVFRDTLDDVTGMIHVKDFLRWMTARGTRKRRSSGAEKTDKPGTVAGLSIAASTLATNVNQAGLNREVLFVPPSMPATDLLVRMQASRTHLAIVIDEYGGTEGLVSIEDLVEVIVGDISDEHDTDEDLEVRPVETGIYMADGRVDLSKLEALLAVDLLPEDEEEEADTLAGLIFKIAGRVPIRGEIIRHGSGLEFEVLDSDARRVKRVRINARSVHATHQEAADRNTDT